ncbi:E3 ubiquitin-protein ligase Hakai isoform X3 [Manduca sexta]|uniref:E3 ubiquitin-protein ligase Hakai n=1 Tax=Manduca sexta TaxID=7130 RepID=A0A921ZRH7_MANSE|nr:E3 ubiquitin-protein ligase Hakai isoform X3 [Manduca sexta]KAG6462539.1 hypothetical protein O3G_MSEX013327 [Manduca sexta]
MQVLLMEVPQDISQLEAPVFTTLQRGPPEPMLRLDWSHRATLIGEKVLNPMIYCCDTCSKPILIYGRMIPCKHVFCLSCARADHTHCPRCREKVLRVEQTGLGTVFMCTHSGTRYGNSGCRRTYLSQRDLQAHINHRHVSSGNSESKQDVEPPSSSVAVVKPLTMSASSSDPRGHGLAHGAHAPHAPHAAHPAPAGERARTARSNLITVPIQDQPDAHNYYNYYPATAGVGAPVSSSVGSVPGVSGVGVLPLSVAAPGYYAPAPVYSAPPPNYHHQPGTSMTSTVSGGPIPSPLGLGSGTLGEGARSWPESYPAHSAAVQWPPPPPQSQHHYYR